MHGRKRVAGGPTPEALALVEKKLVAYTKTVKLAFANVREEWGDRRPHDGPAVEDRQRGVYLALPTTSTYECHALNLALAAVQHAACDYGPAALAVSAQFLGSVNPDLNTLWNYRRKALLSRTEPLA